MELRDARAARRFARSRPVIECAQCGAHLYVPEWSEYLDGGGVRHLWRCEACDYTFETTVRFAAA
jgi:transposase-like protein